MLNQAGKAILINNVSNAILIHTLATSNVHNCILNDISKINISFFLEKWFEEGLYPHDKLRWS